MSAATATAVVPVRRARSRKKLIFFLIFGALTVFVTYMKNARILDPSSPIAQHFAPAKWFLVMHAFSGALAMSLGTLQFSNRLRARYLPAHRIMGYIYVASVFISAPFAIPVAMRVASLSLVAASAVQSFGWMLTTAIALSSFGVASCATPALDDAQLSFCHGVHRSAHYYSHSSRSAPGIHGD